MIIEAPEPQRFTELLALLRQHRPRDAALEDSTGADGVQSLTNAVAVEDLTNAIAVEDLTNADEATVKQCDEPESVVG